MNNGYKLTQHLLMNILKNKNKKSAHCPKASCDNLQNYLLNPNSTTSRQGVIAYNGLKIYNNSTARSKYKTSKNSPERVLIDHKINLKQSLIDSKFKNSNKFPIKSTKMNSNNNNKLIQSNQTKEDIIKKIIMNKKKKKVSNKNINNSMSLSNSIYGHNNNMSSNNLGNFLQYQSLYMKKYKNKIKNEYMNHLKNKINNPKVAISNINPPNSYRQIKQKLNKGFFEDNNKNVYYEKSGKYFNLIKKYVASSSLSSKQPQRQQKSTNKNKFNTITLNNSVSKQNTQNKNNINSNIRNNCNLNTNQNLKNNFFFSSTMNSFNKTKQNRSKDIFFDMKLNSNKGITYFSKQLSRKHSQEKSTRSSMNHSGMNNKKNSIGSNCFARNYISPLITTNQNNNKKSDIFLKKNNKNNLYNFNKKNKFKIKFHSSCNSKENNSKSNKLNTNNSHKEKKIQNLKYNLNNISHVKKNSIEKIFNQLYINKDYNYKNNSTKDKTENIDNKRQLIPNIKSNYTNTKIIPSINNIVKTKNKSSAYINSKNNFSYNNSKNNLEKNITNNSNNTKIDKFKSQDTNKITKNENNKKEKTQNSNKITEIYEDNKIFKEENILKTDNDKYDKDLTSSDDGSLLEFVNNNIDFDFNSNKNYNDQFITESNDSIISTLKDNVKYTCYNRDMEIISSYLKKFYNKNCRYPKTKIKFYKYGRLLGKGAFGKVNLGLHLLTGRLVAIKTINKEKIENETHMQKIKTETKIMKKLSKSNNIVKFYEYFETKKHICIVMEYICAGDLLSYIKKRTKLTETVAKFIFKQIILSLKYIHNNNIVHRDIKLDNILIDIDNNIKICDFGVSKFFKKDDIILEQCGTPAYMAPEILKNKGYKGEEIDIWSSGVVLYAMLSGTVPFKGDNLKELKNIILSGKYKMIKDLSPEGTNLLEKILEVEPSKRIKIDEILKHPWLNDLDFDYWKNHNLFTNAEYVLLAKSNVDYRNMEYKDDMLENFDIRNLDTIEEKQINKNVNSKSFILTPFNTSITEESDEYENDFSKEKSIIDINNPDLQILNGAIKFKQKVRDLNRNYELNNNNEIDNGIVITQNESENDKISKNSNEYDNDINNEKINSKDISPLNEKEENNFNSKGSIVNNNYNCNEVGDINEKALDILENLGYKKSFVKEWLSNNCFNYATASYHLIVKYCFSDK